MCVYGEVDVLSGCAERLVLSGLMLVFVSLEFLCRECCMEMLLCLAAALRGLCLEAEWLFSFP